MKSIIKYTLVASLLMPMFSSCLDEVTPTEGAIQEQIEGSNSSDALVNAVTKYLNTVVNTSSYSDVGYPSMMIRRDVISADMPVRDPAYYYFQQYAYCHSLGHYQTMTDQWSFYNKLIHACNVVLRATDPNNETAALNLATAHMYRAFACLDMARMYEFMPTGTSLDQYYGDIKGLTVPIVTEYTTEAKSFDNPRAPFYKMYRYILHDLDLAELYVTISGDASVKNKASKSAIYGMKARLWLEIATRFDRFPEDLTEALAHENEDFSAENDLGENYALDPLGVGSALDAYAMAADYALMAREGHTMLTESEWFNPKTGFNSSSLSSWMLAIVMGSSDEMSTSYTWQSWVSFMCPEASWGVSGPNYKASHMIDKSLYDCIDPNDWRRYTWIGPGDINEDVFYAKYASHTNFTYDDWSGLAPYVGLKFHPGQGDMSTSQSGNIVDIPLMRVEEMYFIEAEARAKAEGLASGAAIFDEIMASRTGGVYTTRSSSLEKFINELIIQKRIEFWGEGLTYFDLRRLGIAIVRGYDGTNHPEAYRLNSLEGYVAPWSTIFIPQRESLTNRACKLNPDPATVTESLLWKASK